MATWYLLNTIRFKAPNGSGVSVLKAGSLINDAQTPLANVIGAGGRIVPASNASAAAAALIAQGSALEGDARPGVLTDIMLAGMMTNGNRFTETVLAGATVAAAAAICPAIVFTPVASGRVRVKAWASLAPLAAGTFTPLLKQGTTVLAAPGQVTGAASQSPYTTIVDFEVDGLTPLTAYTFSFVSTAGDATVTLGHGSTGVAASFTVEELS